MLQLLGPATHFLTCSDPAKYLHDNSDSEDVYLDVGVGHRKRPEEAAQPLDVSALLKGLTNCGHLALCQPCHYHIMEHIERIISSQDNAMWDRSVTKLTQLKIKIYTFSVQYQPRSRPVPVQWAGVQGPLLPAPGHQWGSAFFQTFSSALWHYVINGGSYYLTSHQFKRYSSCR